MSVRYHGSAMIVGQNWHVELDPEAAIMLKRIFARVDKTELGQMKIRRSPEVDKLLQWFADLYPIELSADDAALLHGGAEAHRQRSKTIGRITALDYTPKSYTLAVTPRDYQRVAADLWRASGGLLLADETGTGKTISAITALSEPDMLPALIVVPGNTLARQWHEQLERCLPGVRVFVAQGQTPTLDPGGAAGWPDYVVIPYHLLKYWGDVLRPRIRSIVYDEVAELRHEDTDKYRTASALSRAALRVLGMSATPVFNYGGEYFAVIDAIRPGALGTREEFDREHCVETDEKAKRRIRNPKAFGLYLDRTGIRLARTRREVGRELPRRTVVPTRIDLDGALYNKHMRGASEIARALLAVMSGRGAGLTKMQAAGEMDRMMRKATGIAKAPAAAAFTRLIIESGDRPVLFGHHLDVYDILRTDLKDYGPVFVTGMESTREKQRSIDAFKAGDAGCIILGLRAQATGLDGLQFHSDVVIEVEFDWSPAIHEQGRSRVDRDREPVARNRPTVVYPLFAEEGSDPVVTSVSGAKEANTLPISYPDMERMTAAQVDPNRAKLLAEAYLARQRR